jgi:serine/threonine protein kinase
VFCGFHLERELGRGAFGRVFLARQGALAGRPVALKVAPDVGPESQLLAQLQHTHIVPVYSVHHQGGLQAVCMPYSGSATLARVMSGLTAGAVPTRAEGLLSKLGQPDHVGAVLALAAALADGLGHAHARGVVHRDIKPAKSSSRTRASPCSSTSTSART